MPTATDNQLHTAKKRLSQCYRQLRENLPHVTVKTASQAICERLAVWPPIQQSRTGLAYLALRNEVDLNALFPRLPHVFWVVPHIDAGKHLVLHPYDPTRLVHHRFGMLEPAGDLPVVDPATLDLVLVPGVAFDQQEGRLGFGGGYYDRLLPTTPALRVGVTYDECLADALPCGEHDQRMDWIVMQSGLFTTKETTK